MAWLRGSGRESIGRGSPLAQVIGPVAMGGCRWQSAGSDVARERDLLWTDPYEVGSRPWPDCSVRRLLGLAFPVAHAALVDVQLSLRAVGGGDQRSRGVRWGGGGWLELADVPAESIEGECRLLGALHLGRCGRTIPVEVVLAPWSTTRSELRLQLYSGLDIPARYFDVAHPVLDNLRDEIQSRADAVIEHRRRTRPGG